MTTSHSSGAPSTVNSAHMLLARLERINVWSLSRLFIGVVGIGFLFTYYDIFAINVSFIQTCVEIKPGCTPQTAAEALKTPLVLNLLGYMVGGLLLSPLSDRFGRRELLVVTMLITGIGSLLNAVGDGYTWFTVSRIITGFGIGADLAVVNCYLNEVAPRRGRARYMAIIFTLSAIGAALGVWLGLILTTPKAPWPMGLPFAMASSSFSDGWRWMYGIGAILALIAIVMRFELPESPQWLIEHQRLDKAEAVIAQMEKRAAKRGPLPEPDLAAGPAQSVETARDPYRVLLTNRVYLRRVLLLLAVYLLGYVTVYTFAAGFTSVLAVMKYAPPEAGLIVALGTAGFIAQGFFNVWLVEKLDRRSWMPICAAITVFGAIFLGEAGSRLVPAVIGSILIFFGFNGWFPAVFALTAESFPTRARTTGFAVADSVGHIGGGIGILVTAPLIPHMTPVESLLFITMFLVIASLLVLWAPKTRDVALYEVSP